MSTVLAPVVNYDVANDEYSVHAAVLSVFACLEACRTGELAGGGEAR